MGPFCLLFTTIVFSITVQASSLSDGKFQVRGFRKQAQVDDRKFSAVINGAEGLGEISLEEMSSITIDVATPEGDLHLMAKSASYKNGQLTLNENAIVELKNPQLGKRIFALSGMPPEKFIQINIEQGTITAPSSKLILEKNVIRESSILIKLSQRQIQWLKPLKDRKAPSKITY